MLFSYIALPPHIALHSILGNDVWYVCDHPFVVCVLLHQRRANSGCDTFSMFFVGNVLGFGGRFLREVSLFKQFIQVSHRVEIHPSEAAKAVGFCWDYAEATFFVALIFCFAISLAMTIARWTDRWHQTSINWAPWFHDQTKPGIQKCRRKPKAAVSRRKEKKQKMDLVQWQRT